MTQIPRSEAEICGLYDVHLYIDYIENNILQTFLEHINYYIHNLYNNMRYIYDTDFV